MHSYTFRGQLTRIAPIGITADGLRLDVAFVNVAQGTLEVTARSLVGQETAASA
jgi:hypothetical protein